jgi:hypothetical protein
VSGDFSGFGNFAQQWVDISTDLISEHVKKAAAEREDKAEKKWDFNKKAPKGPMYEIVQIETAAFFITVASRALDNKKAFERTSLMNPYLIGELAPHCVKPEDLNSHGRQLANKRISKAIRYNMATLVTFGLFEAIDAHENAWRITEKGVELYESLKAGPSKGLPNSTNGSDSPDAGR